jgi:hypothetical protein
MKLMLIPRYAQQKLFPMTLYIFIPLPQFFHLIHSRFVIIASRSEGGRGKKEAITFSSNHENPFFSKSPNI